MKGLKLKRRSTQLILIVVLLISEMSFCQTMGLGVVAYGMHDETLVLDQDVKKDSIWWDTDSLLFVNSFTSELNTIEIQDGPPFIYFRVVEEQGNRFLVIIDEDTKEGAWIDKNEHRELISWLDFLRGFDAINIGTETLLHDQPDSRKIGRLQKACPTYKVIQMQDDWIEIKSAECDMEIMDRGWVKWHNNEHLTVTRQRNE